MIKIVEICHIIICIVGVLFTAMSYRYNLNASEYYAVTCKGKFPNSQFGVVSKNMYRNNPWLRIYVPTTDVIMRGKYDVLKNNSGNSHVITRDWYIKSRVVENGVRVLVYSPFSLHRLNISSVYTIKESRVVDVLTYQFSYLQAVCYPLVVFMYMCVACIYKYIVYFVRYIAIKFGGDSRYAKSVGNIIINTSTALPFVSGTTFMVGVSLHGGLYSSTMHLHQFFVIGVPAIVTMCAVSCVAFGLCGKNGIFVFGFVSIIVCAYYIANMYALIYVYGMQNNYLIIASLLTLLIVVLSVRLIGITSVPNKLLLEHKYLVCVVTYLAIAKIVTHLIYHVIK